MSNTIEIVNRFSEEVQYIQRFVSFIESKSMITESNINETSLLLSGKDLPRFPERELKKRHSPYEHKELLEIKKQIESINPILLNMIDKANINIPEMPERLEHISVASLMGEWIEYFRNALTYNDSAEEVERALGEAKESQEKLILSGGLEATEWLSEDKLRYAIDCANYLLIDEHLFDLERISDKLLDLDLSIRICSPETEINHYRQGFLSLMTALDAAVFDIIRIALRDNFFSRITPFGKKIALSDLERYTDFNSLRDDLIEEQLKPLYLKDIIFILRDQFDLELTDKKNGDRFIDLLEMIQRRNLHVHNRGIVDSHYLERNKDNSPKYNIFQLKLEEIANIDQDYWDRANRLCKNCVIRIAKWAND